MKNFTFLIKNKKFILIGIIIVLIGILINFYLSKKESNNLSQVLEFYTTKDTLEGDFSGIVHNYQEYQQLKTQYEIDNETNILESNFKKNNYLYYGVLADNCSEDVSIQDMTIKNNTAYLTFKVKKSCENCLLQSHIFMIPIPKNQKIEEIKADYQVEQLEKCDELIAYKPILYLYPKTNMSINIKLEKSDKIITSYPKYQDGWNVLAHSNGDLYDQNGKYYYALYWDEYNPNSVDFKTGFYVTKEEAIPFLEEKLSIIGLNDKEKNEFIMYWLPKLEENKQSLVYFELTEEREKNNKLIINPTPDSILRVNMHIKKVDSKVNIKEQVLTKFQRIGFTAVEWGGTIHSN
ncbi:MAG: hypothetical protein MR598_02460 [Erysipelotrichaceae bacterium]|nr:hypothetical protein [Erysipelotrichaceae bacterium]